MIRSLSRNRILPRYISRTKFCRENPVPPRPTSLTNRTLSSSRINMTGDNPPVQEQGQEMEKKKDLRYIDIGINLTDPVFRGNYHDKQAHEDDFEHVVQRARDMGVRKMMVTGSDLKESEEACTIARLYPGLCYGTIGVHPCAANQFENNPKEGSSSGAVQGSGGDPDGATAMLTSLKSLALREKAAGHCVAFGEIGLDYDRLFLTPKEEQLKYFEHQLDLAIEISLPLFLHMRAACDDFERLVGARIEKLPRKGLVHSFTGTSEELNRMLKLGLDVGVNGCSMKTEENLEVVRQIPLERMQIETDGPWCEIRPSHASSKYLEGAPKLAKGVKKEKWTKDTLVKGRNEPCSIGSVAHVIAKIKGVEVEEVTEAAWRNSVKMFGLGEKVDEA